MSRKGMKVSGIARRFEPWEFAGWGSAGRIDHLGDDEVEVEALGVDPHEERLGELPATAICGNDITSSVLYVSALTISVAGVYAPLGLLLVSFVLFAFRKIYGEVGSALPLNGGAYTVLLNTTNKKIAATAATLTIISYLATAVISATEAMHYLHSILPSINPMIATVGLLGFFATLNIVGIKESSGVAIGIFLIHLGSLSLLCAVCVLAFLMGNPSQMLEQLFESARQVSPWTGIALGFCAGMLGISGFESSANFIEEQRPGVFPKTLKNMWLAVTIFNPLVCVLALLILGTASVNAHQGSLLSELALQTGGPWLQKLIGIDAVLVLSGAVLTSYVGVTGLVRRMTLDRCLPQFLLKENSLRKTNHWIILSFFGLACLVLWVTHGQVTALASVYSLSFLSVMGMFALGNLLLKKTRSRLPRDEVASLTWVLIGFVAVVFAALNYMTVPNLKSFSLFVGLLGGAVALMFSRVEILRLGLFLLNQLVEKFGMNSRSAVHDVFYRAIGHVHGQPMIYFSRGDDLRNLNRAALYVLNNEQTSHLIVVNAFEDEALIPPLLPKQLKTIDQIYPELRIDFIAVKGRFGPQLVEKLSRELKIPKNCMFVGTPGEGFRHSLEELGGVRIIL